MIKKGISILLALCLVLALLPVSALAAEATSGACGTNARWSFDASTGTLSITGTGDMKNYVSAVSGASPWRSICSQVQHVVIENGITGIGNYAFPYINALQSVSIPQSVSSIGHSAFRRSGLTSVTVPGSITKMGTEVFSDSPNLETVVIEEGITSLGESMFLKCSNLNKVTLPESLIAVGSQAFSECTGLTDIILPSHLETIGYNAFSRSGLTQISIPASVTFIDGGAFSNTCLKSVTVPGTVKTINNMAFIECKNLETVVFEEGITYIPYDTFINCTNLKSVKIPNSVTWIGRSAFDKCSSLTEIAIPQSVTEIQNGAFSQCDALKNVYYAGSEAEWKNIKISNNNDCLTNAAIHFGAGGGDEPGTTPEDPEKPSLPTGTAEIVSFAPKTGSTFSGNSFDITFDREIAERTSNQNSPQVDLTIAAPFQVHRASDDSVVYSPGEFSWPQYTYGPSKSVLRISPNYSTANGGTLRAGEQYYVTMGAGFVKFADGSLSPEIKKGEWEFTAGTTQRSVNITMKVADGKAGQVVTALWDDEWFKADATVYNHELARTSAALCGASYVEDAAGTPQSDAIESALNELEFDVVTPYNYPYEALGRYDNDVVGYTFGFKQIDIAENGRPVYVVAVVIKGTSANEEWFSNFNVGYNSDHLGFSLAEEKLWKDLEMYLTTKVKVGIEARGNLNFVITGHSRGAAVANMLAARLTDSAYAERDDVFAYTFATPTVSKNGRETGYENIFNIISGEDFVTRVPLSKWGFRHYGIDLLLPSRSYTGSNYDLYASRMSGRYSKLTGNEFNFYENGTQDVDNVLGAVYGLAKSSREMYEKKYSLTALSLTEKNRSLSDYFDLIADIIVTGSAESIALVGDSALKSDFHGVTWFFINHNMLNNRILAAHGIATYYSWLTTQTPPAGLYHAPDKSHTNVTYKRTTISCPVDVYVYDESNNLVASVVDEAVVKNTLAIHVEGGVKTVDLPSDQNYDIRIVAREEGTVLYEVREMTARGIGNDITRTVAFNEIPIAGDDTLTGRINDITATPVSNYTLTKTTPAGVKTTIPAASDTLRPGQDINFTDVQPGAYFYDAVAWAVEQGVTNGIGGGKFGPNNTCNRGQIVTFLWRAAGEPEPASAVNPFTDVKEGDYFYKAVLWAVENEITTGSGAGKFNPGGACTRAQAVTFLWRANKKPQAGSSSAFGDVAKGSYYENAVAWAVENGVTNGTGAGRFNPDGTCTRGQIVTFLYRCGA